MKNKLLINLVNAGIVLSVMTLLFLPMGLTAVQKVIINDGYVIGFDLPMVISVAAYIAAVPYMAGLFSLRKISMMITSEDYFDIRISEEFNRIAYLLLSVMVILIVEAVVLKLVFDFYMYAMTIIPLVVGSFVIIVAFVLMRVFSEIFRKANEIKKENDDTV